MLQISQNVAVSGVQVIRIVIEETEGCSPDLWDCAFRSHYEWWVIHATTDCGRRFQHHHKFQKIDGAKRLATRIFSAGAINTEHWVEGEPSYGSDAYQQMDMELTWRERELEREGALS